MRKTKALSNKAGQLFAHAGSRRQESGGRGRGRERERGRRRNNHDVLGKLMSTDSGPAPQRLKENDPRRTEKRAERIRIENGRVSRSRQESPRAMEQYNTHTLLPGGNNNDSGGRRWAAVRTR